jgi:hypothetical protein
MNEIHLVAELDIQDPNDLLSVLKEIARISKRREFYNQLAKDELFKARREADRLSNNAEYN